MKLTDKDKITLLGLAWAFSHAEIKNAANPDVDTFKFDFDLKICVLLKNVIMEVLKNYELEV